MPHDHFRIIRVKTTAVEWFVLAPKDLTDTEVTSDPLVGQLEADLRARLANMGFPEAEVEMMFREARNWMSNLTHGPRIAH